MVRFGTSCLLVYHRFWWVRFTPVQSSEVDEVLLVSAKDKIKIKIKARAAVEEAADAVHLATDPLAVVAPPIGEDVHAAPLLRVWVWV